MKRAIRICLAGPHKLMNQGLCALFENEPDFQIVGSVAEGLEAVELVRTFRPDAVIVDLVLHDLNAMSIVAQLKKQAPKTRIVVLSFATNDAYASQALRYGAHGYVLKSEDFSGLIRAIREAVAGREYLSPRLDRRAIKERQKRIHGGRFERFESLTRREQQVLLLAAEGHTSSQIATALGISPRTAETHRSNIYKKLRIRNRAALTAMAVVRGLISRDI